MASMAYYGLDEALLDDGQFDDYCKRLADNWSDLTPQRQFALGSATKIRTTGYHVRVSTIAEQGCIAWLQRLGRFDPRDRHVYHTTDRRESRQMGRWLPCTAYTWGPPL